MPVGGGMKPYRRKGGDIQATKMTAPFVSPSGDQFDIGDYLVLDAKGNLDGAKAEAFEADFELVKKNYNKPKPKKAKAEKAAETAAA